MSYRNNSPKARGLRYKRDKDWNIGVSGFGQVLNMGLLPTAITQFNMSLEDVMFG